MKYIFLFLAMVLVVSIGFSQATPGHGDHLMIPKTLSEGTEMRARDFTTASYDDTTQAISTDGWNRIFVVLNTATNDSIAAIVSYQGSVDGATFGPLTVLDSLSSTGTVGVNTAFELPAKAMGFPFVRVRVYASGIDRESANPATDLTTYIRRKRH